ncbi:MULTISPECIES: hypothetical protein [unclassified Corallococcus]|uniref:hypothetical protein n=1 Tax=unclassified Corallococcus TaxID=2685029 RepID=UPI001A8CA269|nr:MULTISPECIES: hypothetical protein [unclassified Corallococcus]MBN9685170.1 hypothetical protein [Corallococcus sp. NCSPR001]WAS83372.1 hypothetical protein O0N60_29165 [Corallococcus sp. NCRR]
MHEDQIDRLTAEESRRESLFDAVHKRLQEVEKEIPALLDEARSIRASKEMWENFRISSQKWAELEGINARVDSLIKEHGVLEGIVDRRDARRWRWVQLLIGGSIAGAVASLVQKLVSVIF